LIDGGQISAVQLDPAGSHGDQFRFLLTTQENIAVNGAKNDSEAIQLIHYMLENTQDPEDRKELVETLSKSNLSSDLAVTALSKALLTEKDPEIQNTLIESIAGQDQPIVKEALLGIVMGEYAESVRLKALEILEKFMDDAYIRNMLSIVAATDEIQTIRDKARQMLMKIKQTKSSIEKKDFEGEIK
nr:hypothetical protein [FCB group bacterium]